MKAWLGRVHGVELIGPPPSGVEFVEWDGMTKPPDSLYDVDFFVVPFNHTPRALEVIPRLRKVRAIQTCTAGFDRVYPLVPEGVLLCNARGVHDPSTAEWVVAAMLVMIREFNQFIIEQHEGRMWQRHTDALAGKKVLLLGHGSIGEAVERRLGGFDVEIVRVASRARPGVHGPEELAELVPEADVVVVLVPLTEATRGLVDAGFLASMRDGALLVNAARGPVVDHDALLKEVSSGRLLAAADVGDPEPLPQDHPLVRCRGFFYSRHQAGHTRMAYPGAYRLIGDQLRRLVAGEPLINIVKNG